MKTIFVIDDQETNRVEAKNALDGYYATYALPSAEKMFKMLGKITPNLIILDIDMPDMNGFEAIQALKSDPKYAPIPVIFLTGKNDPASEIRGFEMGVIDFILKPFSPPVLIRRIETHLETDKMIKKSNQAMHDLHNATISVIANLVESRDTITGKHIERTQSYLKILVEKLVEEGSYSETISGWDLNLLLPSAQLHDVGKIKVSDVILNKPSKLNAEEFNEIKKHSAEGEHIVDEIINQTEEGEFLIHAKKFAGYHHERWDGTGYPYSLRGEEIPLEGRIMAVADVYDALVSERPYKRAFTHEQAVDIIKQDSGTHFDPKVVDAFLKVTDKFKTESEKLQCGARKTV